MNMICHETPGENLNPETLCLFLDILQVAAPIFIALENSHRADTPLGDVVWITGNYYSRYTSHSCKISSFKVTCQ